MLLHFRPLSLSQIQGVILIHLIHEPLLIECFSEFLIRTIILKDVEKREPLIQATIDLACVDAWRHIFISERRPTAS